MANEAQRYLPSSEKSTSPVEDICAILSTSRVIRSQQSVPVDGNTQVESLERVEDSVSFLNSGVTDNLASAALKSAPSVHSMEIIPHHDQVRTPSDVEYWKERAEAARLKKKEKELNTAKHGCSSIAQGDGDGQCANSSVSKSMDGHRTASVKQLMSQYSSKVVHSGWLIKRGHKVQNFKHRLFVLMDKELVYHNNHNSKDICGRVDLSLDSKIVLYAYHGFQIVQRTYAIMLYASDEHDRQVWIDNICKLGSISVSKNHVPEHVSGCCCTSPTCTCTSTSTSSSRSPKCLLVETFSGWLRKRGRVVKSHKRRWFVLNNCLLTYHVSPQATSSKGSVDVSKAKVYAVDATKTGERHSFVVRTPHRTLVLFADNNEERALWMTYIQASSSIPNVSPRKKVDSFLGECMEYPIHNSDEASYFNVLRDIRKEAKLTLASPYSPEGTTSANFIAANSHESVKISDVCEFMSGLTDFTKKIRMHELRIAAGQSPECDVLDKEIAQIIREEVEERVFFSLHKFIYHQIRSKLNDESRILQEKLQLLKSKPQSFFGISKDTYSHTHWLHACRAMRFVDQCTVPFAKRARLMEAANEIYGTYRSEHPEGRSMGADEFTPVFIYVIVNSNLEDVLSLRELLTGFDSNNSQGEEAYFVTCFEIAIEYLKSLIIQCTVVLDTSVPLGIGFHSVNQGKQIVVKTIIPDSQAHRSGVIKVGDELLAVNGIPVKGKSLTEIAQILKNFQSKAEFCFKSSSE